MHNTFYHRFDDEFYAFIEAGELRIPVRTKTGQALSLHNRAWCFSGDQDVHWSPASGRGTVLSFTITRRPYKPEFPVPLIHGWIELKEGPCLICRILDITPEKVAIGQEVQAGFDEHGLLFRPIHNGNNKPSTRT